MVALPNLLGFVAMQVNGWHSDRNAERRWHTSIPLWTAAAALLVLSLADWGTAPSLLLFSIASASLLAFLPSFWAMPSAFLCDSAAALATGTINCVSAGFGGFVGPALVGYEAARTHSFRSSFAILPCGATFGQTVTNNSFYADSIVPFVGGFLRILLALVSISSSDAADSAPRLVYGTYLGGRDKDGVAAIAVDSIENATWWAELTRRTSRSQQARSAPRHG
jgi:hypothetical protein